MLKLADIKNRVASIKLRFDALPEEKRRIVEKAYNTVDYSDLYAYQTLQSEAFATLKMDFDASMWLYNKLGGELPSPKKWQELPLEEKAVITLILGALANVELGTSRKTH